MLLVTLAASLALHAGGLLLVSSSQPASDEAALASNENDYLRKVVQKERAKGVIRNVGVRITMPPEPLDPERIVTNALEE